MILRNFSIRFFVAATLVLSMGANAQNPQLSDQQIQALKEQYLSGGGLKLGGALNSPNTSKADDIAKAQQAVQPLPMQADGQPPVEIVPPSAIETSMRDRLESTLKASVKEEVLTGLQESDLAKADKDEQRSMAKSRQDDLELRSSWERFLENAKVRGVDSHISQFGYELFAGVPNTFTPAADIPVPPEYVLGPGDELQMQFYGGRDDTLTLVVDRNGTIEIPKLGSLSVAGLSFVQAKALIAEQLNLKSVGVSASVTMGKLRSIRIFVLGDVDHPGSYLVSGLSTISHALFAAGGVSKSGSLRHIQLKRKGKTIGELDLYEFLLKGNSRGDERLMPGDVVFIPPLGRVIGVAGKANRPAIYELRDEKSAQEVIKIAGGALADADVDHMQIDRINTGGDRILLDSKLSEPVAIQNGDILMLFAIPGVRTKMVSLLGQFKRPGQYGWHENMMLGELIRSTDDLMPGAFFEYALIQRTDPLTRTVSTVRVSLDKLLVQHDKQADVALKAEDQIYVFAKSAIDPLNVVTISGSVVNPGKYPFTESMRVLDLLFAAGGPNEESYLKVAELTRYDVIDGGRRESSHFEVNLGDALAGNSKANLVLKPHDQLFVRAISNWKNAAWVELKGEFVHPGKYPIAEGERLSSVLKRAGGYSQYAYLRAAFFTRESVRQDQQKQLDELARQTESEITKMASTTSLLKDEMLRLRQASQLEAARRVSEQLNSVRATGRVVIELDDIDKLKGTTFDIALRDGDGLVLPRRPDEVLVLGEVYNQTAFVYRSHADSEDYLNMAGGPTRMGDIEHFYVVRANGMVDVGSKGWFSNSVSSVEPGDAIIVPQLIAQSSVLDSTLDWSRVIMQLGVSMASMKTIGVFK